MDGKPATVVRMDNHDNITTQTSVSLDGDTVHFSPEQYAVVRSLQQRLGTLAEELRWYERALSCALRGKAVREASHHDASTLLKRMGL